VFGVQNGGEARALRPKALYEPHWSFSTVLHGVEVSRLDCVCPYVWWCPETCMVRRKRSDRKPCTSQTGRFSTVLIHKQAKFSYGCHTCQYIRSWFNLQEINEKWSILSEMWKITRDFPEWLRIQLSNQSDITSNLHQQWCFENENKLWLHESAVQKQTNGKFFQIALIN
jgi:hypothetical protein